MNPLYAAVALLLLFSAVAVSVGASTPEPSVLEDGADCFAALPDEAGVTCSVLYAHIWDLLGITPLSVEPIPPEAPDLAAGFTGTPGIEPLWGFSRHQLVPSMHAIHWSASGPGFSRGPGDLVQLVPDVPIHGYWFLSADSLEMGPLGLGQGSGSAGAIVCLTVEMQVREGFPYREGASPVIAQGKTTHSILTVDGIDEAPLPIEDPCPDSAGMMTIRDVQEFHVEMQRVPGSNDTHGELWVSVLWYQVDPSGDPETRDKVVQREWNQRSGAELRPRILFPVESPVRVEATYLAEADGIVGMAAVLRSPWGAYEFVRDAMNGSYDIRRNADPERVRFLVIGPDGEPIDAQTVRGPGLRYNHGHNFKNDRLNLTYLWQPGDEPGLLPGTYTLVIEADNLQRTATARAVMTYDHAPETGRESPMLGAAVFLGVITLALLGFTRRRVP